MDAGTLAASLGDETTATASFKRLVERLSAAAVRHRWEAHRDIDWDAPEHRIDPADPCWEAVGAWDPMARSDWYRDQPPERRSVIGLHRHICALAVAIEFEAVLSQGLLRFAGRLPNRHPAFRFIYHEIAEEAQHSMMFREVIDRSGLDPPRPTERAQALFERMAEFADRAPVIFFLAILSGEEAFDHLQRRALSTPSTHPLIRTVSRIHVVEEARHVSFARALLRQAVSRLEPEEVRPLRYQVPFVIQSTADHMFGASALTRSDWGMPTDVVTSLSEGRLAREMRRQSMSRIVRLCRELSLVDAAWTPWSKLGDP